MCSFIRTDWLCCLCNCKPVSVGHSHNHVNVVIFLYLVTVNQLQYESMNNLKLVLACEGVKS